MPTNSVPRLPPLTPAEREHVFLAYRHGLCRPLAVFMAELCGSSMVWSYSPFVNGEPQFGYHCGVVAPDGQWLDITGPVTRSGVVSYYTGRPTKTRMSAFEVAPVARLLEIPYVTVDLYPAARWKMGLALARMPEHPLSAKARERLPALLDEYLNDMFERCRLTSCAIARLRFIQRAGDRPVPRIPAVDAPLERCNLIIREGTALAPRPFVQLWFPGRDLLETIDRWLPLIGGRLPDPTPCTPAENQRDWYLERAPWIHWTEKDGTIHEHRRDPSDPTRAPCGMTPCLEDATAWHEPSMEGACPRCLTLASTLEDQDALRR